MPLEWLLWACLGVIVLSLALRIPGLEVLIRPLFSLAEKLIVAISANLGSWLLWLVSGILRAHRDVAEHLLYDEEHFDLRLKIERANRRS